jgi:hypothetical protein
MRLKGVNYDVGRIFQGHLMRPAFDTRIVFRELEIITTDLHANAVKIQGNDINRLITAAEHALKIGLNVWLAPELFEKSADETLDYAIRSAAALEPLWRRWPQIVLSIGTELTGFMQGILPGANVVERFANPEYPARLRSGEPGKILNAYLAKATAAVRRVYHGPITYASLAPMEQVDWTIFDVVGIDLYRDAYNRRIYGDLAHGYLRYDKPVAVTEFGCCTYRGAEDKGGSGFDIVDFSQMPPKLKGNYVYDQDVQARELSDQLRVLDAAGVDGAFVFEFVQSGIVINGSEFAKMLQKSLTFDPDISSYALVKSLLVGNGTTYPDMPWEPKASFRTVADYYARH